MSTQVSFMTGQVCIGGCSLDQKEVKHVIDLAVKSFNRNSYYDKFVVLIERVTKSHSSQLIYYIILIMGETDCRYGQHPTKDHCSKKNEPLFRCEARIASKVMEKFQVKYSKCSPHHKKLVDYDPSFVPDDITTTTITPLPIVIVTEDPPVFPDDDIIPDDYDIRDGWYRISPDGVEVKKIARWSEEIIQDHLGSTDYKMVEIRRAEMNDVTGLRYRIVMNYENCPNGECYFSRFMVGDFS